LESPDDEVSVKVENRESGEQAEIAQRSLKVSVIGQQLLQGCISVFELTYFPR